MRQRPGDQKLSTWNQSARGLKIYIFDRPQRLFSPPPHFPDAKTMVWTGHITCPRSLNKSVREMIKLWPSVLYSFHPATLDWALSPHLYRERWSWKKLLKCGSSGHMLCDFSMKQKHQGQRISYPSSMLGTTREITRWKRCMLIFKYFKAKMNSTYDGHFKIFHWFPSGKLYFCSLSLFSEQVGSGIHTTCSLPFPEVWCFQ